MNIYDIQESISSLQEAIAAKCKVLPASRFGLDPRCGTLLFGPDFLVSTAPRLVDYYGGFEYVGIEFITQVGTWKVYSTDDERIATAWECANDTE